MATGKKGSELPALAYASIDPSNDLLTIFDNSDATDFDKKIAVVEFTKRSLSSADISWMAAQGVLSSITTSDKMLVYDDSATAFKWVQATKITTDILANVNPTSLASLNLSTIDLDTDTMLVYDASAGIFKNLVSGYLTGPELQHWSAADPGEGFGQQLDRTTDYTVLSTDDGSVITNIGASGPITLTLPAATAGMEYAVMRIASYTITVEPDGSETIRHGAAGQPYIIDTRTTTVFACVNDGEWEVLFGGNNTGEYNVLDFGADPTGTDDSTAAIQATIDAAGNVSGTVFFPRGTYKHGPLTYDGLGGITFKGDGPYSTFMVFVPTADNQVGLTIDRPGTTISDALIMSAIEGMRFSTTDTTYNKTAIKIVDSEEFRINDVYIREFKGDGTDSIGLWTLGRQMLWVDRFISYANVPIRIGVNPDTADNPSSGDTGWLSADLFHFSNCYLWSSSDDVTDTLIQACVLIDDKVQLAQLTFDGVQSWILGNGYGMYWKQTAGNRSTYNSNIHISNLRCEQATDTDQWNIHLECINDFQVRNFHLQDSELDSLCNGIYMRYVNNAQFTSCQLMNGVTSGKKIIDIDSFYVMRWDAVQTYEGADSSAVAVGAYGQLSSSAPHPSSSGSYYWPTNAIWTKNHLTSTQTQKPNREFSSHRWTWAGQVADDAAVYLPCTADAQNWVHARIDVTATVAASNKLEYGVWRVAPITGLTNGVVKESGSTNTGVTNIDGNIHILCNGASPMYDNVYFQNRLGATAYVTIEVVGKRSVET